MSKQVAEVVEGMDTLSALDAVAQRVLLEVKAVRQVRTRGLPRMSDEQIRQSAQLLAGPGAEITR